MVVHAGAEERDLDLGGGVARGERAQLVVHLLLGQTRVERQLAREPQALRYVGEQLLDAAHADRREHLAAIFAGGRDVAAHESEAS